MTDKLFQNLHPNEKQKGFENVFLLFLLDEKFNIQETFPSLPQDKIEYLKKLKRNCVVYIFHKYKNNFLASEEKEIAGFPVELKVRSKFIDEIFNIKEQICSKQHLQKDIEEKLKLWEKQHEKSVEPNFKSWKVVENCLKLIEFETNKFYLTNKLK